MPYSVRVSSPWLLAIETSVANGAVALASGGRVVAAERLATDRRHAAELFPAIRRLLKHQAIGPAELAAAAFSAGPGSFTGLRIAAVAVQMLSATSGCAAVAVPTLEVIAAGACDETFQRIVVILNAKRGQVFTATYRIREAADGEFQIEVEAAPARLAHEAFARCLQGPCRVVGEALPGALPQGSADIDWRLSAGGLTPRVEVLARLAWQRFSAGNVCAAESVKPMYLRPPECEEVYDERRAAARARRGASA